MTESPDEPKTARRPRRPPTVELFLAALAVLVVSMILGVAYHECGRTTGERCVDGAVLQAPGWFADSWCVSVHTETGWYDSETFVSHEISGLSPLKCFDDEAQARQACEHGVEKVITDRGQ